MTDGINAAADEQTLSAIGGQPQEPEDTVEDQEDETLQASGESDAEDDTDEDGQDPQPEADEDLEEIEFEGKSYKLPKEIRLGIMRNRDYTQKTQEVAEMRRSMEAQKEQAAALFKSSEEYIEAKAYARNLDNQLQQYQNLDWQALESEDPIGASSHWRQFQMLKEQRGQVDQYLSKADAQRTEKAEQDIANRIQETRAFAEKEIPGWTPEVDVKIIDFATKNLGFEVEQIRAAVNPAIYKTLHLAWIGAQSLERQKAAANPKPQAQVIKPLQTVKPKGGAEARKEPGAMSMEEFAAYRNRQERARSLKR